MLLLAQSKSPLQGLAIPFLSGLVLLTIFAVLIVAIKQYKRCPSNRVLVIYGSRIKGNRTARCMHGGGVFVWPLIQDYQYLSLEPITIDIELSSALSKKNIRVNVPSTFTIGISTQPDIMNNAAERLLGLAERDIATQSRDIILGQMRLVIATLSIEEINQDREKFLDLVNKNVNFELNKIGLEMINVNIRDITDESGYIEALGQKAAAEAINQAEIDKSNALREGAIGTATANREKNVRVAEQTAQGAIGEKEAERDRRIKVAQLEAAGVAGEASAAREREIAVAEQTALAVQGKKEAESNQRVKVASLEASAVSGENESKASIADYEATLEERRAIAKRRGEVAMANAQRDVLLAEREREQARLEKEQIVLQEIEKKKIEIDAEAEADRIRRIAQGEADATLARYKAEAEGIQQVLMSKAHGYENLLRICGDRKDIAPSLLIIEQLPQLVSEQVKAIQNLKIDKITVWDSGANGSEANGMGGSTSNFLKGLIGSLPPIHELAQQAGIELPEYMGKVSQAKEEKSAKNKPTMTKPNPESDKSA
ncbi:MAG: flotillin [Phycisphaeraceae bacterium]|nr:flotillin [Phycisphaeraceae bacterium]